MLPRRLAITVGLTLSLLALSALAEEAHLVSYGGHGTTERVVVRGQALKGAPSSGAHGASRLRKAASTAHAFLRRDLERAPIEVEDLATGVVYPARTDDEGFYEAVLPGPHAAGLRVFRVRLGPAKVQAAPVDVTVRVVAAAEAGLVIVCDLDDTLVMTGVTGSKVDLVRRVATSSADDMHPFPHAAEALTAFARAGAPIIYVSASPVELAPRIGEFLAAAGLPPGDLFLRRYADDGVGAPTRYKRERIDRVLADFPARRLVLVGDNGESDPEIYAGVARDGGRVAAILIHQILPAAAGDPRYAGMVLFADWASAARAAADLGLLRWLAAQRVAIGDRP
jgi:phosphatidate phosphatase APP1